MKRPLLKLLPALLLIAFTAKAFVPIGMMFNVRSYMIDGVLVTICSSAGDLPWMPVHASYDGMEDGAPNERCPMAGPDAPVVFDISLPPAPMQVRAGHGLSLTSDLTTIRIEKRAARGPPESVQYLSV